jgi:hypothetical protein
MLRILTSFEIFAAVIASWFYLYSGDPDGAKCDQTCVADSAEEPQSITCLATRRYGHSGEVLWIGTLAAI